MSQPGCETPDMAVGPPTQLLETIRNLAEFHRLHEEFYAQAPLSSAVEVQRASGILKALADQWRTADPVEKPAGSPYAGAEDLNAPGLVSGTGVLFLEGEGEPAEIAKLKRDLETLAADMETSGEWLGTAMEQAWQVAGALAEYPELADLLGERHRIISNDWQSADMQKLVARLLRRALELLERIVFSPAALRADLAGERNGASYLYSASELADRAADLITQSAVLVHDNERRWRVFRLRIEELLGSTRD